MQAFLCRTPIQVFRAVQIQKLGLFDDKQADIYLFDTFAGYEKVASRLQDTGIFEQVYPISGIETKEIKHELLYHFVRGNPYSHILKNKFYNILISFNITGIANELGYYYCKKNNRNIKYINVEDAPNIYNMNYRKSWARTYLYPLLGVKDPNEFVDEWWFSRPELMNPPGDAPKYMLPVIDKNNEEFKKLINYIFDYQELPFVNQADILFMEESFYTDGRLKTNEDLKLLNALQAKFPDLKFVVKLHPRTQMNRFKGKFMVVPNNGIPWEVYVMNQDFRSKLIVSISCSTTISSSLLFGCDIPAVLVYPMFQEAITEKDGSNYWTTQRLHAIKRQDTLYNNTNCVNMDNRNTVCTNDKNTNCIHTNGIYTAYHMEDLTRLISNRFRDKV